jgi:hypothetical protein
MAILVVSGAAERADQGSQQSPQGILGCEMARISRGRQMMRVASEHARQDGKCCRGLRVMGGRGPARHHPQDRRHLHSETRYLPGVLLKTRGEF